MDAGKPLPDRAADRRPTAPELISRTESSLSLTDRPDTTRHPDPDPVAGPAVHASSPARRSATRVRSGVRRAGPFVLGVLATFLAIVAYGIVAPPPAPLTTRDVNVVVASALASQTPGPPRSELVFGVIRPSIVLIDTEGGGAPGATQTDPAASADPERRIGTGVVVSDSGAVLTALHVVDGVSTIHLTFADGSKSTAQVAAKDVATDIAVLQPDTPPQLVIPATLGNPGSLRIGSEAYIVGNPFGLYGSLSTGVVSGLDRSFESPDGERVFHGLIQVDAAVNPGNSGGPLVDRNGRVVGIVTALLNPTKQDVFIGIGLAVPIDVAGGAAGLPPY